MLRNLGHPVNKRCSFIIQVESCYHGGTGKKACFHSDGKWDREVQGGYTEGEDDESVLPEAHDMNVLALSTRGGEYVRPGFCQSIFLVSVSLPEYIKCYKVFTPKQKLHA